MRCRRCRHDKSLHVKVLWTDGRYRNRCNGPHPDYYSDNCPCKKYVEDNRPTEIPI